MYKLIYLDQKVLDICEIVMYKSWNDYMEPRYGVVARWNCYLCDETKHIYVEIAKGTEIMLTPQITN